MMAAMKVVKTAETVDPEVATQVTAAQGAANQGAAIVVPEAANQAVVTAAPEVANQAAEIAAPEAAHQVTLLVSHHFRVGSARHRSPLLPIQVRRFGSWSRTDQILRGPNSGLFC